MQNVWSRKVRFVVNFILNSSVIFQRSILRHLFFALEFTPSLLGHSFLLWSALPQMWQPLKDLRTTSRPTPKLYCDMKTDCNIFVWLCQGRSSGNQREMSNLTLTTILTKNNTCKYSLWVHVSNRQSRFQQMTLTADKHAREVHNDHKIDNEPDLVKYKCKAFYPVWRSMELRPWCLARITAECKIILQSFLALAYWYNDPEMSSWQRSPNFL